MVGVRRSRIFSWVLEEESKGVGKNRKESRTSLDPRRFYSILRPSLPRAAAFATLELSRADGDLKVGRTVGKGDGVVLGDITARPCVEEGLVLRQHPVQCLAVADGVVYLREVAILHETRYERRVDHDFLDAHATLAIGARHETLADDSAEGRREFETHLALLVRREGVDDAVHALIGIVRVERGKNEVSGLGGLSGDAHRLCVAHLAYEDDVRILAQGAAESLGERGGVYADFALVDQAPQVVVDELDRVLDGDDMQTLGLVEFAHHGGKRGRFARPRRTGEEHKPLRIVREGLQDRREAEVVEGFDGAGNATHHHARLSHAAEDVHAETVSDGRGLV